MATVQEISSPCFPIKISKWKVKKGSRVFKGSVLALYEVVDRESTPGETTMKLKASSEGTVQNILVEPGMPIESGTVLITVVLQNLEICAHATVMKDMCADCGKDLQSELGFDAAHKEVMTASVAMVHNIPELIVSEDQAQELGREDVQRLLKTRKLVLLVDLDQTLIHTTIDNIPTDIQDVYHFQMWDGQQARWYHTKLRPYTREFLDAMSLMYELHICTFGNRLYAHTVARFLDPHEKFFAHRILSRDECFDPVSKTANLKALFPCGDAMVCIIDDREDVWNEAPNMVRVKPYRFFQGTADINAPPTPKCENQDVKIHTSDIKEEKKLDPGKKAEDQDFIQDVKSQIEQKHLSGCQKDVDLSQCADKVSVLEETHCLDVTLKLDTFTHNDASGKFDGKRAVQSIESSLENGKNLENGSQKITSETYQQEKSVSVEDVSESKPLFKEKSDALKSVDVEHVDSTVVECEEKDDYLLHLADILKRVHTAYYSMVDQKVVINTPTSFHQDSLPDLKSVIPYIKRKTLKGRFLVFSGLVPLNTNAEKSRAYVTACSLGASVQQEISGDQQSEADPKTTHLVALKPGTRKHKLALKMPGLHIVRDSWLWACDERWEHCDELLFPIVSDSEEVEVDRSPISWKQERKRLRTPEEKSSISPEAKHLKSEDCEENPSEEVGKPPEKKSGPFSHTLHPLLTFSDNDLECMDKEVDELIAEDSSASEDETDNEREERFRSAVLVNKSDCESGSSSDSLSGEFPRGWGLQSKPQLVHGVSKDDLRFCQKIEDQTPDTENELADLDHNMTEKSSDSESDSFAESIGSVDDEIADAVEKEFLGGL